MLQPKGAAGAAGSTPEVSPTTASRIASFRGGGEALSPAARSYFEPRFGRDLSAVRLHTGGEAAAAAGEVQARAFTIGSDIAFAAGEYRPDSVEGKRLLAHELTHTVQQGAEGTVRREEDFRVAGVQPRAEDQQTGATARFFFDFDRGDLRPEVPDESAERARVEAWAQAHSGTSVRLVGHASPEGDPGYNERLAERRAATIAALLEAHGVTVTAVTAQVGGAERAVEYRYHRSVEVIPPSASDSCSTYGAAERRADLAECERTFARALDRAQRLTRTARRRLASTDADTDRDQALQARFPGEARSGVLARVERIERRLGEVGQPTDHECHPRCEEGCNRAASAGRDGPVKLCPAFYSASGPGAPMSRDLRTFAVLHEVTHSAGVGIDIAYSSSRLFDLLELGDAQNNADSHVVLILTLARAGRVLASRRTAPPSDRIAFPRPDGTADPGRETAARRALGYAGSWLNYAAFWTASFYDWEASSLSGWSSFGGLGQAMAEIYAPLFQLQRPGLATTPTLDAAESAKVTAFQAEVAGRGFPLPPIGPRATTQDRTRVAAVYDRFARLYEGTKQDLTVGPAATGDGQWDPAPGLPGVGANILLPTAFFGEGRPQQVRRVVRLAARALADIPSHWTEAYVEAADGVRRYRGLGPS